MDVFPLGCPNHPAITILIVNDNTVTTLCTFIFQHGKERLSWQIRIGKRKINIVQKRRQNIISRSHRRLHRAFWNHTRVRSQERHLNRILIHIHRISSIAFTPKTMLPARIPIVRGKHHKRIFAQTLFFQLVQNPPHIQIHRGYRRKISLQTFALPQIIAQPSH